MKFLSKIFIAAALLFGICGCATSPDVRMSQMNMVSKAQGFTQKTVKGGDFWLATYQKITNPAMPYVFYIEGDGLAFSGKYEVSENPTPMRSMLILLAGLDERPNVVYIARPCQYIPMHLNPRCDASYWTDKRMSDGVVNSISEAIDSINNGQPFSLVGFSGGGGIAVLIGARNPNLKDIITVAGNLDHVSFNKFHRVRPMVGSLNPIDYATEVNTIPQLHVSGGLDNIVPAFIAERYVQASHSACVKQEVFANASHQKGWEKLWPYILGIKLNCSGN